MQYNIIFFATHNIHTRAHAYSASCSACQLVGWGASYGGIICEWVAGGESRIRETGMRKRLRGREDDRVLIACAGCKHIERISKRIAVSLLPRGKRQAVHGTPLQQVHRVHLTFISYPRDVVLHTKRVVQAPAPRRSPYHVLSHFLVEFLVFFAESLPFHPKPRTSGSRVRRTCMYVQFLTPFLLPSPPAQPTPLSRRRSIIAFFIRVFYHFAVVIFCFLFNFAQFFLSILFYSGLFLVILIVAGGAHRAPVVERAFSQTADLSVHCKRACWCLWVHRALVRSRGRAVVPTIGQVAKLTLSSGPSRR